VAAGCLLNLPRTGSAPLEVRCRPCGIAWAIQLGAAGCLFTPVDPDRLRGAVERDLESPPIAARR
jgi:hypothetical protein